MLDARLDLWCSAVLRYSFVVVRYSCDFVLSEGRGLNLLQRIRCTGVTGEQTGRGEVLWFLLLFVETWLLNLFYFVLRQRKYSMLRTIQSSFCYSESSCSQQLIPRYVVSLGGDGALKIILEDKTSLPWRIMATIYLDLTCVLVIWFSWWSVYRTRTHFPRLPCFILHPRVRDSPARRTGHLLLSNYKLLEDEGNLLLWPRTEGNVAVW